MCELSCCVRAELLCELSCVRAELCAIWVVVCELGCCVRVGLLCAS